METNHWLEQELKEHLAREYEQWQAMLTFERAKHKQELEQMKTYLCDKVDEYLLQKSAEFYAALACENHERLAQFNVDCKEQVTK